jgi:uncharacterized protein YjbJ (UPF0337 family)
MRSPVKSCIVFIQFIQEIEQPPTTVINRKQSIELDFTTVVPKSDLFNKERIMSLENKAKATAKNIEGKVQEAVGNLTGDPKTQAEGKGKQAEAKVRHAVEDVKDEVKKAVD